MKSLFEQRGGTYRREGDYLIPNLVLPDTGGNQIGKYGRMRRRYLKEHRKVLYTSESPTGSSAAFAALLPIFFVRPYFLLQPVPGADWGLSDSNLPM